MEKRIISACVPNAPVDVNTLTLTSRFRRYLVIIRLCSVYLVTIDIDLEGATLRSSQQILTQAFASMSLYQELGLAISSVPFKSAQVITSSGLIIDLNSLSISLSTTSLLAAMS